MIKINITRKDSEILKISMSGHSGYAEQGKDIVCAAASTIIQTAILGLEKFAKGCYKYKIDEKKPILEVEIVHVAQNDNLDRVHVILETAVMGLKDLEKGYDRYIRLEDK